MALSPGMAGAIGGGIAGLGAGLFGGNDAQDQYNQYTGQGQDAIRQYTDQATGYLDPYRQAGQTGMNNWQQMLGHYQDPMGYYNQIANGYQMSPGAQFRMKTGMDAVRNAQASQGLGGSGAETKALTDYTQGVIGQDQQQYINNVLGIGNTGLQGYGQMAGMGLNAAGQSGQFAMSAGQDLASMYSAQAQAAAEQANSDSQNMWGGLGSLAGGVAGWAFGGPAGGAMGAKAGSMF